MLACLVTASLAGCADLEGAARPDTSVLSDQDKDRDGVPDSVEYQLCSRSALEGALAATGLGSCDGVDWKPEDVSGDVWIPSSVVPGPDADGDALPSHVEVVLIAATVDVFSAERITFGATQTVTVTIDEDDTDADVPAPSIVQVSAPIPTRVEQGPDGDGDGLGSTLTLHFSELTIDRRLDSDDPVTFSDAMSVTEHLDRWDDDADMPVLSRIAAPIPTGAHHTGDGDGDRLPGAVVLSFATIEIDRRDGSKPSWSTMTMEIPIDLDDADRDDVVPYHLIDDDMDLILDDLEPIICGIQDRYDDADGRCVRDDGTGEDGSGDNYVLPSLDVLATLAPQPPVEVEPRDVSTPLGSSDQVVPGPWLGLIVLALLGAVIRRR